MSPARSTREKTDEFDGEISVVHLVEHVLPDRDDLLVSVAERVLRLEARHTAWNVSIVLTSDDHLRQLHSEHLSDDSVTDVMTFHYGPESFDSVSSGEIVISVDRAIDQAREAGWPITREIVFLTIHGLLHLFDWEDSTPTLRDAMLARQHEIMDLLSFEEGSLP